MTIVMLKSFLFCVKTISRTVRKFIRNYETFFSEKFDLREKKAVAVLLNNR